ncbi:MAG: hypothetical protein JOY71_06735 [Acetobacteraceae bacterium]|nr:hypothetical protein [Acetobacteraceae bacterium]MBV8590094.1 hypothetical protein [Acetobacteraceae bacterium]
MADQLIGSGRTVRCAQCGHYWAVVPEHSPQARARSENSSRSVREPLMAAHSEPHHSAGPRHPPEPMQLWRPETDSLEIPAPVASPSMRPADGARPALSRLVPERKRGSRPNLLALAAWAGSVAVILIGLWAAYAWRQEIMQAWPASERLYAGLGLKHQQ